MRIQLVLADDWELRGDGSGNMSAIQFDTIRRLCDVYERHGLCGSFNVEVMQQLVHRRFGPENNELAELAHEWEEVVRDVYRRGHDVQLHLHPQWTEARYENGRWELGGRWSILQYSREEVDRMIGDGKRYLEGLLSPIDPGYRCVSFRSGSWCIAPGEHVLAALADAGIVFDISIVEGLRFDTEHVSLDYRRIDESFLPFYPRLDDARRIANEPQPIVCVPTHSFRAANLPLRIRKIAVRLRRWKPLESHLDRFVAPNDVAIPNRGYDAAYAERNWRNREGTPVSEFRVADLSMLSYGEMTQMLRSVRRRALDSGWKTVPIVLENHTKDVGNLVPLDRFAAKVASAPDLEVLRLTELARNIERGEYPIRTADGL